MRWKALAEIYTMHSFAPFGVEVKKLEKPPRGPQNQGKERAPFSKLKFMFKIAKAFANVLIIFANFS